MLCIHKMISCPVRLKRISFFLLIISISTLCSITSELTGQNKTPVQILNIQDGADFGWDFDVRGDFLIFGADSEDSSIGPSSGVAYIYIKGNNGEWNLAQRIEAPDQEALAHFGASVSISADRQTIAVGANSKNFDGGTRNVGAVYIYHANDSKTQWIFSQKLIPETITSFRSFGDVVHLSDDGNNLFITERSNSVSWYNLENGEYHLISTAFRSADDITYGDKIIHKNELLGIPASYRTGPLGQKAQGAIDLFSPNLNNSSLDFEESLFSGSNVENERFGSMISASENYIISSTRKDIDNLHLFKYEEGSYKSVHIATVPQKSGIYNVAVSDRFLAYTSLSDSNEDGISDFDIIRIYENNGDDYPKVDSIYARSDERLDLGLSKIIIEDDFIFLTAKGESGGSIYIYQLSPPDIKFSPGSISFDYQCKDSKQTKIIRITNNEPESIDLTFAIANNSAGHFQIDDDHKLTLESGISYDLFIDYNPRIWISNSISTSLEVLYDGKSKTIPITVNKSRSRLISNEYEFVFTPDNNGLAERNILLELENVAATADPIAIERIELDRQRAFSIASGFQHINTCIDNANPRRIEVSYDGSNGSELEDKLRIYHSGAESNPIVIDLIASNGQSTNTLNAERKIELSPDDSGKAQGDGLVWLNDIFGESLTIEKAEIQSNAFFLVSPFTNVELIGTSVPRIVVGYDALIGNETSAILRIYHNGANESPIEVTICVPEEEKPDLQLSTDNLTYDYQCEGNQQTRSFTIFNNSDFLVDVPDLVLSSNEEFSAGSSSSFIDANSSVTVEVTYTAKEDRHFNEKMAFLSLRSGVDEQIVELVVLRPIGQIVGPSQVTFIPDENGKAEKDIVLTSDVGAILIEDIFGIKDNFSFEILGTTCIDEGGSVRVRVKYDSDPSKGDATSTVMVVVNNGLETLHLIPLIASLSDPEFVCSRESIEFPYLKKDEEYSESFYLKNIGGSSGELASLFVDSDDFEIISPLFSSPVTIAPNDSLKIEIRYNPKTYSFGELHEPLSMFITGGGSKSIELIVPNSNGIITRDSINYKFNVDISSGDMQTVTLYHTNSSGRDPILVTEISVSPSYYHLVEDVQFPFYLDFDDSYPFQIRTNPSVDATDGELRIEYHGDNQPSTEITVPLLTKGNASASIISISPERALLGKSTEALINRKWICYSLWMYILKKAMKKYASLKLRYGVELRLMPSFLKTLNPGIYDLVIRIPDNFNGEISKSVAIHRQDLILRGAFEVVAAITGKINDININLNTGIDRPPVPLANAEVVVRASGGSDPVGDALGRSTTNANGEFEIELEKFNDFMWVEASFLPSHSKYIVPPLKTYKKIQPFTKFEGIELSLPVGIVNDILSKLEQLEKIDVTYQLPLISPIVSKKFTNTAYDVSPILIGMDDENLYEYYLGESWKIESLKRIDLAAKGLKEHMDLMSALSPELSKSMINLMYEVYKIYNPSISLHNETLAKLEKLGPVGQLDPAKTKEYLQLTAIDRVLKGIVKVVTDLVKKSIDRAIVTSFPQTPQTKTWVEQWNKAFGIAQNFLLTANLGSGLEDLAKKALMEGVIVATDQFARVGYFYSTKPLINEIGALSKSGFEAKETFQQEVSKYNTIISDRETSVNSSIEIGKTLEESVGALNSLSGIFQSLATIVTISSGGSLLHIAATVYAAGQALNKISLVGMVAVPVLYTGEMIITSSSLNGTIDDLKKNHLTSLSGKKVDNHIRQLAFSDKTQKSLEHLLHEFNDKKTDQLSVWDMLRFTNKVFEYADNDLEKYIAEIELNFSPFLHHPNSHSNKLFNENLKLLKSLKYELDFNVLKMVMSENNASARSELTADFD